MWPNFLGSLDKQYDIVIYDEAHLLKRNLQAPKWLEIH